MIIIYYSIVRLTSINLQNKILKNPVFKSTTFFSRCILIYTLSIFYCQTNTDNGSDTNYKLTRSSPLHINH